MSTSCSYCLLAHRNFLLPSLLGIETAHQVKWLLIPEQTIEGGIRPDGVLRDSFDLKRGFWEAKGPQSDLDKEIAKKIATGYPLTNTIFENTKRAILFQNKKRAFEYDLHNPTEIGDLLAQFFTYTEPDIVSPTTLVSLSAFARREAFPSPRYRVRATPSS